MTGLHLNNHFSLTSSINVDALCEPLKRVDITYFNYLKIDTHNGSRELLTNNAEWIDYFYQQAFYLSAGAVSVEHLLPKGYFLWSELDVQDPVYQIGREFFNIDNGITFVVKKPSTTQLYIFASQRNNEQINHFYVKNLDCLRRFILYFHDKGAPLLKEVQKNRILLPQSQCVPDHRSDTVIADDDREQFYSSTDIDRYYLIHDCDDLYLTKKQAECAALLAAGATNKYCAKKLSISPRTVEDYLNTIKEKIFLLTGNRLNKIELMDFLKQSGIHEIVFPNDIAITK